MDNLKKEIIEELDKIEKLLKENSGYNFSHLTEKSMEHLSITESIVNDKKEGGSFKDAIDANVRSYDEAFNMCLEHGANADKAFITEFTSSYIATLLGIAANLLSIEGFVEDKDNLDILKKLIRDSLIYADRL